MIYSACKLNKQGDNIQPWRTPFPVWKQSVVPCPILIVASWPAFRFLKRKVKWSGIPISWRIFHSLLWSTQSKVWNLLISYNGSYPRLTSYERLVLNVHWWWFWSSLPPHPPFMIPDCKPLPRAQFGFIFVLLIWESELDCGDSERDLLYFFLLEAIIKACEIFFFREHRL